MGGTECAGVDIVVSTVAGDVTQISPSSQIGWADGIAVVFVKYLFDVVVASIFYFSCLVFLAVA